MPRPYITTRVQLDRLLDPAGLGAWDVEVYAGEINFGDPTADATRRLQGLGAVDAPAAKCQFAQPFDRVALYVTGVRHVTDTGQAPPTVAFELCMGRCGATVVVAAGQLALPDFGTTGLVVQVEGPLSTSFDLWARTDDDKLQPKVYMTFRALIDRCGADPSVLYSPLVVGGV